MDDKFLTRWLVQVDEYRWLLYDEQEDIEDWDVVLEIKLPREMALMLDYTQHSYFQMQAYFEAQWEVMQKKLEADEVDYTEAAIPPDDMPALLQQFEYIVKKNELDKLGKEETD